MHVGRKYFATVNMKNKTGSGIFYPTYRASKREFPTKVILTRLVFHVHL